MSSSEDWEGLLEQLEEERAQRQRGASPTPAGEQAWEELQRRIQRVARIFTTREDLDDLVQNILVKLQSPEALRRLRAARSPSGYLTVMVRNAAIDLIRRQASSQDPIPPVEEAPGDPNAALGGLDHQRRVEALRLVMTRLSESDRLLLRLRFWEEQSIAEIAIQFGMPYSTIAVRLFRLLRRLRMEFDSGSGRGK